MLKIATASSGIKNSLMRSSFQDVDVASIKSDTSCGGLSFKDFVGLIISS
jgi:hypothetical protein